MAAASPPAFLIPKFPVERADVPATAHFPLRHCVNNHQDGQMNSHPLAALYACFVAASQQ
jgi:hypothetical protein